ncbi:MULTISPECIES: hypothetical protein [unclassified Mycoplasma]|uniref:hypothetical protein n=1 Tax=unclassified Mycoplasma TaxID=2683645 RepID=UPI000FDCF39F
MILKTYDFHGLDVNQAASKITLALLELDNNQHYQQIKLIVGQGQIVRQVVIDYLEKEGYEWKFETGNFGAIIVTR